MLARRVQRLVRSDVRGIKSLALQYDARGDPLKKLKLVTEDVGEDLGPQDLLLQWIAAPMNPADVNMIQGTYPLKPPLPAVAGNEGVARVFKAGSEVKRTHPEGSLVIPACAEMGTWRQYSRCEAGEVLVIPAGLSLAQAATALVNPPTAYRMLHDFQKLEPGDAVLQNGANSAVGKAVVQIAHKLGLRSINVIRGERSDFDEVKMELMDMGADFVVTEADLRAHFDARSPRNALKKVDEPKLALNCVGGKYTAFMAAALRERGSFVTYGGMSRLPNSMPIGAFIFKDIEARGFWMSRWYKGAFSHDPGVRDRTVAQRGEMFDFLFSLMKEGKLKAAAHDTVPLESFKNALEVGTKGSGRKQILLLSGETSL